MGLAVDTEHWSALMYTQLQLSFLTDQRDRCLFLAAGSQGQRFALRVVGGQLQLDMVFNSTLKFSLTFSGRGSPMASSTTSP